jgi:uncharacterized protein (TIGR00730 family)
MSRSIKNIAIFGGAEALPSSPLFETVFNVSKELAHQNYTIVNGGGPGVMLAATQGAEAGGGKTLAVTCNPKNAPGFEGRYVKNHTDKVIKTHNYIERMFTLMEHGDCYIIFNGGTGTISEFGTAWCLARLYYGHHKPFILYGDFWKKIITAFENNMMMRKNDEKVFKIVNSTKGVIEAIRYFSQEKII